MSGVRAKKRAGAPFAEHTWKEARIARQLLADFRGQGLRIRDAVQAAIGTSERRHVQRVEKQLRKLRGRGAAVPRGERAAWKRVDDVLRVGYDAARERGYQAAAARLRTILQQRRCP